MADTNRVTASLPEAIQQAARRDDPAIVSASGTITYGELERRVASCAVMLYRAGVRKGDRVAISLENSPEFVVVYLATLLLGAIVVSVNPRLRPAELARILSDCSPKVVLTDADVGAVSAAPAASDQAPPATQMASSDDPAAILYTSGSTGEPKGAVLSHRNIVSNAMVNAETMDISRADSLLLVVPLFHCYGQNAVMNVALVSGACLVVPDSSGLHDLPRLIDTHRITVLSAVPSIVRLVLERTDARSRFPLRSLRLVVSSSAPLPPSVAHRWQAELGIPLREAYGLTECTCVTFNHTVDYRPGSIGSPLRGIEVEIRDESGRTCDVGEEGELWVRGPNVTSGYWNNADLTRRAISDGWLRTRDLGTVDASGYIDVRGRTDDLINVSGLKVHARDVETVLLDHPSVAAAAVVGEAHHILGERVVGYVVLEEEVEEGAAGALRAHCSDHLAPHKLPAIVCVPELPTLSTGKLDRVAIRAGRVGGAA